MQRTNLLSWATRMTTGSSTLRILASGPWQRNGVSWLLYALPCCSVESYNICPQVSFYSFVGPLSTFMMAPALPEIATKYSTVNTIDYQGAERLTSTISARYHKHFDCGNDLFYILSLICPWTPNFRTVIRDVWSCMGKFCFHQSLLEPQRLRSCTSVT
jgi:hypothetical protein